MTNHIHHLLLATLLLMLTALTACGSSGGVSSDSTQTAYKAATLKINLTGTLPSATGISGAVITLNLPSGVTPFTVNGAVTSDTVTPSGTFAEGTQVAPVYTAALGSTPATLKLALASSATSGVAQVGEVATVLLQLSNNVTPSATDFNFNSVSVIDAEEYRQISGMGASVASITLK